MSFDKAYKRIDNGRETVAEMESPQTSIDRWKATEFRAMTDRVTIIYKLFDSSGVEKEARRVVHIDKHDSAGAISADWTNFWDIPSNSSGEGIAPHLKRAVKKTAEALGIYPPAEETTEAV